MSNNPIIKIRDVYKSYGSTPVLRGCNVEIKTGEVVVICGPSGSGKSTLIKCINGLESYQAGSIRVEGVEVGAKDTNLPRLRSRVGMVFQHFELYPHMSALDNIVLAQVHVLKRSRANAQARAHALLKRIGLAEKADVMPAELSGGQRQRVAIARALALDPCVILFDEPTSALDPEMIQEVLQVIMGLASEGMTMVVITHEMGFARQAADRIVFMDRGEVVEDSSSDQFFSAPQTERAATFLSKIMAH